MSRRALHLLALVVTIASTLATLVAGGTWALSYFQDPGGLGRLPEQTHLSYQGTHRVSYVTSLNGWIRLGVIDIPAPFSVPRPNNADEWVWFGSARMPEPDIGPPLQSSYLGGLILYLHWPFASGTLRAVAFPHALVLVIVMLPALLFGRRMARAWHRRQKGLCQKCGYNLTGNTSGRCPECGTPIDRV